MSSTINYGSTDSISDYDVGFEYFTPIGDENMEEERKSLTSAIKENHVSELDRSISPWIWKKGQDHQRIKSPTSPILERMGTSELNRRNSAAADLRLSMLSNFSTAYNVLSISLALHMMDKIYTIRGNERTLCSSALIAGMIIGQLGGGALGDLMGRHMAMTMVMFLQVVAAFASALSFDPRILSSDSRYSYLSETGYDIFHVLAVWRLIEGIGCGGVYPLAATLSAESCGRKEDRAKNVAITFSMQGVGYLTVPIIGWILILIFGENSDLAWRILLGIGSLPGLIVALLRRGVRRKSYNDENDSFESLSKLKPPESFSTDSVLAPEQDSMITAIFAEPELYRKLIGTAGCWFIFDVLFYGNTLFQPVVLSAVFGDSETISDVARDTSLLALIALPGYFVTVLVLGKQSPKWIQLQGFVIMSILYMIIGYYFDELSSKRYLLLTLYGLTFFFSDYGPNSTTFMLPSMTFSPSCRSTLNGISAASGKVGALIGAIIFEPAAKTFGNGTVMLFCAVLCFLGMIMTLTSVRSDVGLGEGARVRSVSSFTRKQSMPSFLDYN